MAAERLYRAILTPSDGGGVTLEEDERKHLVQVRRLAPGERFLGLLEGRGWQLCRLDKQAGQWSVKILEARGTPAPVNLSVTLAQSLIKRDRFELVLQKATELGVSTIVPLVTTHTIVGARDPNRKQLARWRRILGESVKQSGRSTIPALAQVSSTRQFLDACQYDLVFYLDEVQGGPLKSVVRPAEDPISVGFVVGPEGGWSDAERTQFRESCVPAVSLGDTILRAETVPIAVLSVLQFIYGGLGGEASPKSRLGGAADSEV